MKAHAPDPMMAFTMWPAKLELKNVNNTELSNGIEIFQTSLYAMFILIVSVPDFEIDGLLESGRLVFIFKAENVFELYTVLKLGVEDCREYSSLAAPSKT